MNFYDFISDFYDDYFAWNYEKYYLFLSKILKENDILDVDLNILEIACWTGGIFRYFYEKNKIDWLDISKNMLEVAKKKYPKSKFFLKRMEDFLYNEKYDLILCLFDSINHLDDIKKREKTFFNVEKSLKKWWFFFFDINTIKKLKSFDEKQNFILKKDDNFIILNRKTEENKWVWNLKKYSLQKEKYYLFEEEKLFEYSFELEKVFEILSKFFSKIEFYDLSNLEKVEKLNNLDENIFRFWFLCVK